MTIEKTINEFYTYNIKLIDQEKELLIYFAGNGDLYMSITNGERLEEYANDYRFVDITKEDEELYQIFDNLYNSIKTKSNGEDNNIISKNETISWISDEGKEEVEDSLNIFKYEDYYKLLFFRNNLHGEYPVRRKNSRKIDIRFSTSGSRYKDFVSYFIRMYDELQKIEKKKVYKK